MFTRDTRGTIAVSAAIGGLVMVAAIGVAFDASKMVSEHHTLQAVADAAALAATLPEDISDRERVNLVTRAVEDYQRQTGERLRLQPPVVDVQNRGERVTVALSSDVELIFGGAVGLSEKSVTARATAEEAEEGGESAGMLATAISFVVDASRDDAKRNQTLANLRRALNAELSVAPDDGSVRTGLYPFNWGAVEGNTSVLQAGSDNTLGALNVLLDQEGSVPGEALELAVADTAADPASSRYVVITLDSEIDMDRADTPGQMLTGTDMFDGTPPPQCLTSSPDIIRAQDELAQYLLKTQNDHGVTFTGWTEPYPFDDDHVKFDSNDSPAESYRKRELLLRLADEVLTREARLGATDMAVDVLRGTPAVELEDTLGLPEDLEENLEDVYMETANLAVEHDRFVEVCRPVQVERVFEQCETAKDSNVKVVGLNMSGENGPAARPTRQCVLGGSAPVELADMDPTARAIYLALGEERVEVAPDGSIYVAVSSIDDSRAVIREILNSVRTAPSASNVTERSVRLVR